MQLLKRHLSFWSMAQQLCFQSKLLMSHEAPRIAAYDETTSTEALQDDVDALDEAIDIALARATQYQQSLRNYHSTRVRPHS
jgi:hypothetical protein